MEELTLYQPVKATLTAKRTRYLVDIGNYQCELIRDVDFGKVAAAKAPSLWKSGAEKILLGYGLYYDTVISDSYKDHNQGFYYYEVIARAYDQNGKIVRTGVGCCNTNEKSFGISKAFDSANSALKKAKKRAIVDLALTLASLSNCFTQDMEDEENEKRASKLLKDNDKITPKQKSRIFAIASQYEITVEQAKSLLVSWGYTSTNDITQKDYDSVCEKLEAHGKAKS